MKKLNKLLLIGAIGISFVAVIRSLFFGLDIDEQYAVTLAYRLAQGDILLKEMWEPHQTSAILPAIFIKIYIFFLNDLTYLLLYLRVIGVLLQLGVSVFWYRVIRKKFDFQISFLTAMIVFHTLPKWIQTTEFTNMQIWFLILTFLSLIQYYRLRKLRYCAMAGFFMVFEVLAYPSCILLFPLYVLVLWKMDYTEKVKKSVWLFSGVCIASGVVFAGYLLTKMSIGEIGTCINYVLADGEHSAGLSEKILNYAKECVEIASFILLYGLVASLGTFVLTIVRKGQKENVFYVLLIAVTFLDQVRLWVFDEVPNVHPQIYYFLLFVIGVRFYWKSRRNENEFELYFWAGWIPSLISLVSVLLLTNLDVKASFVHLLPGALCTVLFWSKTEYPIEDSKRHHMLIKLCVVLWCTVLVGSRIILIRATEGWQETIFFVKQKALEGAATGIYCEYMVGYQYNADYVFLQGNLDEEDRMLYIGPNALTCLTGEGEVCAASTISTPIYDERYIDYYRMNEDKSPTVVVIDKAYWGREEKRDAVIDQWIKTEFNWEERVESEFLWIIRKK